jgi:hypothetical protein
VERTKVKAIESGNLEQGKAAHWKRTSHCNAGEDNEEWKPPQTTGWRPICACGPPSYKIPDYDPIPCTVLDPFAGSGTVGVVAAKLGREFVLMELNPEYAAMAEARLAQVQPRLLV